MKKTIAAVAMLAASTQSFAMPRPPEPNVKKVAVCLAVMKMQDKALYGSCDQSNNNKRLVNEGKELLSNGCLAGQVRLTFDNESPIESCMPPGMVQL